jgi:hypothetical protein
MLLNIGRSTQVSPDCGISTSVTSTVRRFQNRELRPNSVRHRV